MKRIKCSYYPPEDTPETARDGMKCLEYELSDLLPVLNAVRAMAAHYGESDPERDWRDGAMMGGIEAILGMCVDRIRTNIDLADRWGDELPDALPDKEPQGKEGVESDQT